MIIRVSSPFGTKRLTIDEKESSQDLFKQVEKEFQLKSFNLSKQRNGTDVINKSDKNLTTLGLRHGDMIYLRPNASNQTVENTDKMETDNGDVARKEGTSTVASSIVVQIDEIDTYLSKQDGRIIRSRNEQFCRHGASGKCIHCVPLEPFDEEYLSHCNPPIKFMSFNAYLRKIEGKFTILESTQCKIRPGCTEHAPWPEGICTKCQPSAITLDIQKYRHIDNIMFENKSLMDDFLDYWRKTGNQRMGILFGYYTTFDQAPLGIKAVVCSIYEPVQTCTPNTIKIHNLISKDGETFLPSSITDVASKLGLRPVGWIFTDLLASEKEAGKVKHYRGTMDTFFLTAQECITAAYLQNLFPNKCTLSSDPNGNFGSKFATVVVTGDAQNTISFEGYQVSNQCMALVRDDILVPTYDAPELGYIRESSDKQFVPDVFSRQTDQYGNTVTKLGRPLPVEFLLVHMTVAFPKKEEYSMRYRTPSKHVNRFPIENREGLGELQNLATFQTYLNKFSESDLLKCFSNLHLLWFLESSSLPLQQPLELVYPYLLSDPSKLSPYSNKKPSLKQHKIQKEADKAIANFLTTPEWKTAMEILNNSVNTKPIASGSGATSEGASVAIPESGAINSKQVVWSCEHCTFDNTAVHSTCQMCGLPKSN